MGFADRAKQRADAAKGVAPVPPKPVVREPVVDRLPAQTPAVAQPAKVESQPAIARTVSPQPAATPEPARVDPQTVVSRPAEPRPVSVPQPATVPRPAEPAQPLRIIQPAPVAQPAVRSAEPVVREPSRSAVEPPRADQTSVIARPDPATQVVDTSALVNVHTLEIGARLHLNSTILLEYDHDATKNTATVYLVKKGTEKCKTLNLTKGKPVQVKFAGHSVSLEITNISEPYYEQFTLSLKATAVPIPKTNWAIGKKLKAMLASPLTYGLATAAATAYLVHNQIDSLARSINVNPTDGNLLLSTVTLTAIASAITGVIAYGVVAMIKFIDSKIFGPTKAKAETPKQVQSPAPVQTATQAPKVMKPKGPTVGQRIANGARHVVPFHPEMIHTAAAGGLVYLLHTHPAVTQLLGQFQQHQKAIAGITALVYGTTIISSILARATGRYVPKQAQPKKPQGGASS